MKVIDLTLRVSERMPVYPGDRPPVIHRVSDLNRGDALTASHLSIGCHVGTHIDAPSHFISKAKTLDQFSLDAFVGPATVVDLRGVRRIEPEMLRHLELPARQHVLLKTDNSGLLSLEHFTQDYCFLSREAAELLCELQPRSVGFDYYSLDPFESSDYPAHRTLAAAEIPAFVCLDLSGARAGRYQFVGLPLRLADAEGAPVRAVLLESATWQDGAPSESASF